MLHVVQLKIDILKRNGRSGDPGGKVICYLQTMEV